MNDAKLKDAAGADYFDELLARIRDIRPSGKRFYQKVRDLFAATSVDYTDRFAAFDLRRRDADAIESEREVEADIEALVAASRTGRTT